MIDYPDATSGKSTMIEISVDEWKGLVKSKNKFGAKKTYCGQKHLHDSKKEAAYCDQLNVLRRSGTITRLKQQTVFVLQKGYWYGHEKIRPITYRADFTYWEDGVYVICDVKGKLTDVYKIKKKMLLNKIKNKKSWKFIET